jgi:hypothetical protein
LATSGRRGKACLGHGWRAGGKLFARFARCEPPADLTARWPPRKLAGTHTDMIEATMSQTVRRARAKRS